MAGFENDIVYAKNGDFSVADNQSPTEANGLVTNGQLWIGSTALNVGGTHINVGTLTSPDSSLTIGYVSPNITLQVTGGTTVVTRIAVQTGTSPVAPAAGIITFNGALVAAGTNPVRTDGTGVSTMALEVQTSQALAAGDSTKVGLSNFNSTQFTVSAAGFVSLAGGTTPPTLGLVPDAFTPPGTSPVIPNGSGNINVLGSSVAAGTNPVRTNSLAANTLTVQVQTSVALAASDATRIGLCNFNSAFFTVDANGFVSLASTGVALTITGDTGGALSPIANNWFILGGPGVTTTGTGNTLTINSVIFTDTTAVTMAVDNGYYATAAGTYNLPATAAQGELIIVSCDTTGAVVIDAPALNFIRLGNTITAASGTITSTAQGDSVTLRYRLSTLTWMATSITGNWIVT